MERIEKIAWLRKEIEKVRYKLYQTYRLKTGLMSHEVYNVSLELDELIVAYQKLTKLELSDEYRSYWSGIKLFPLYQRIEDLCVAKPKALGFAYEATIRGRTMNNQVTSAFELFSKAKKLNEEAILDYKARMASMEMARLFPQDVILFLNARWKAIETGLLFVDDRHTLIPLHRIVLEVTEQSHATDIKRSRGYLDVLRRQGLQLAIDDFGTGYSNFHLVAELEPEYVKLDKSIIRSIATSESTRRTLSGLVSFADQVGTRLIAEGIETKEQLQIVKDLGVSLGQGYFLENPKEWKGIAKCLPQT